jgi:hypothetical protein
MKESITFQPRLFKRYKQADYPTGVALSLMTSLDGLSTGEWLPRGMARSISVGELEGGF